MDNDELKIIDSKDKVIQATAKGDWIPTGTNIKIECYVLENGDRIFSLRRTARTLDLKGGGALAVPRLLSSKYLQPYLSSDLKQWVKNSDAGHIQKVRPPDGGNIFHGFKGSLLVDLADAFYKAKINGDFNKPNMLYQSKLANRLHNITLAFSKVGIDAFIDEITGYQEKREKDVLQKLLNIYVEELFQPWNKMFPNEFYKEIYRLKGWKYIGSHHRTPLVGQIANTFIYDFLPKDVMDLVRQKKKSNEKLHQWLTSDYGKEHLTKQLTSTIALMRASNTWNEFEILFNRSFNIDVTEQLNLFSNT